MAAFNIVRFRVKPALEQQMLDFHRQVRVNAAGFLGGWLVKTGDQTYCMIGQWRSFQHIVKARPEMAGVLDQFRAMLENLDNGLGVTDPVSGDVSVNVKPARSKPRRARAAKRRRKAAGRKRPSRARR
jgi:hypothetical protein